MAMNWRQRLEKLEHEGEAWFQERARQVAVARDELEHAGARAYELASRTGRDVLARTPDEVRQLGQAVVQAATEKRTTPRPVSQPAKAKTRSVLSTAREAALQVDTVMRSAANTITLGGADRLAAGIDAALASGKGGNFEDRYKQELAEHDARNRYDAEHRPLAQGIGNVLGGGLAIAAIGPLEGPLAAAPRMIGAAKLTGR